MINPFDCRLTLRYYTEYSLKITRPLRAVLITDLHSTKFGQGQEILLRAIHLQCPDLILMAGDIADHRVPVDGTRQLLKGLKGTCPCFYVSGNHEQWTRQMPAIRKIFTDQGVTVLGGDTVRINLGFFPRFAGGRYELGSTALIVSRGLCLNRIPRIYNPPELVIVDLKPIRASLPPSPALEKGRHSKARLSQL